MMHWKNFVKGTSILKNDRKKKTLATNLMPQNTSLLLTSQVSWGAIYIVKLPFLCVKHNEFCRGI